MKKSVRPAGSGGKNLRTVLRKSSVAKVVLETPEDEASSSPGGRMRGDAGEKVLSEAMQYCSQHVKDFMSDSQKANTYLKCGKFFMEKQGDYLSAIECFNEGINWNPIVSLYTFRAAAHKTLNMWTEAYFDYSFAVRLEPENGSHFCHRGLCLTRLKRMALAVEDLDQACAFDPQPLHFYSRGTILADSGQNELAIPDFTHALTFVDSITHDLRLRSTYRRALANFELRRYEECLKDLAALLQQDPNSVQPRALMGRTYKMLENLKRADEQLTLVLELEPGAPEHHAERGDIRFRTGDKSLVIEAVYDFDKAVRLYEDKIEKMRESMSRPPTRARLVGGLRAAVAKAGEGGEGGAAGTGAGQSNNEQEGRGVGGEDEGKGEKDGGGECEGDEENKEELLGGEEGSLPMDGEEDEGEDYDDDEEGQDEGDGEEEEGAEGGAAPAATKKGAGDEQDGEDGAVSAPMRGEKKRSKGGSKNGRPSRAAEAWQVDEAVRLMADALFRRGQAKLLIAQDSMVLEAALEDAQASSLHVPEDDDYQLLMVVCLIRLERLDEAMQVLRTVLQRSPHNEKALYQFAFCQRTRGRQKDAIEGLTKIISHWAMDPLPHEAAAGGAGMGMGMDMGVGGTSKAALAVPLERVFETRGTLFHEIQAHTFALADLGRAVAMDPERAGNYYLRGDCHSKLGNYELAVADLLLAEQKGFADLVSLWSTRGMVYRLLGDSESARRDFEFALLHLPEDDAHRTQRVRLSCFRALCFVDRGMYHAGHDVLEGAVGTVSLMERRVELGLPPFAPPSAKRQEGEEEDVDAPKFRPLEEPAPAVVVDGPLLSTVRRLLWTLCYHAALTLHMQRKYAAAAEYLQRCTALHMQPCAPDDFALGAAWFFLGVQHCQAQSLVQAEDCLRASLGSKWGQVAKNTAVIIFALGKLCQQQLRHDLAIDYFSQSIAIDAENAHAFFRRAWSHKSSNDFVRAGSDFETAKQLRRNDPNFQVDYRRISSFEYMVIESEPDLMMPMAVLVPSPGGGI